MTVATRETQQPPLLAGIDTSRQPSHHGHFMDLLSYLFIAVLGALIASFLALIPALHVYNVITLAFLLAGGWQTWLHPDQFAMLLLGMVTGYAVLSVIPSIYLAAPDETSAFIVLPGQKWLLERRGYEAAVLTGVGSLCGVIVLVLLSPFLTEVARTLRIVLAPHFGWILAAISLFMLMSEWPRAGDRGPTSWARFRAAWSQLGAGLLTFFLSGLLGLILLYRNFMPVSAAFVNLLPAFIGLFAIPTVLTNLIMGTRVPPQHISTSLDASPSLLLRGAFAGTLGGLFAAFFPVVTGSIGAFLAGHATAQRDERSFLVSQGVSKLVYYAGGFLLFFLPGLQTGARRAGCHGQHHLHAGHAADVLRGGSGVSGLRHGEFSPADSVCALCRALSDKA